MARASLAFGIIAAVVLLLWTETPVRAQGAVTYVAGSGADTVGCGSQAGPCATLSAAVAKTDPAGVVKCLAGGFGINNPGTTIDKPITIDCGGNPGLRWGNGSSAITVNISEASFPDAVVILRGITFVGFLGHASLTPGLDGIRFVGGGAQLHVEDCRIFDFAEQGIDFRPTSSVDLFVSDTIVSNNAGGGVLIRPAADTVVRASLRNVQLNGNGRHGLAVAKPSGNATVAALDTVQASRNAASGLRANGESAIIVVGASTITYNGTGLSAINGGKIRSFGNNEIAFNGVNGIPTSTIPLK